MIKTPMGLCPETQISELLSRTNWNRVDDLSWSIVADSDEERDLYRERLNLKEHEWGKVTALKNLFECELAKKHFSKYGTHDRYLKQPDTFLYKEVLESLASKIKRQKTSIEKRV